MYRKILIANRGEIAVRIIRACREMGIATVAVCSTADRESLHARLADECICIGGARASESYLNVENILSAAVVTGAQAIHPGFGFLSENTRFARMCEECGLDFIGPSADSIEKMGDKSEARHSVMAAGVPVVPGSEYTVTDAAAASRLADDIGYPLIIKAAAGGGGKGMRVANEADAFSELFEIAKSEARQAFGDERMYLEKFLGNARHIEFQVLADKYGNVLHLGERDCSVQRRHQKLIEEAPAVFLDEKLRQAMGADAVKVARAAGYYSAGTVEFLVDENRDYYFMEMNTRVQVEHPVTEMSSGIDIIKAMIRIAAGERLEMTQADVKLAGHSIECRINAENPAKAFMPCTGTIDKLHLPGGNGVRVDSSIYNGYRVSPFYDAMLAKIITHAPTRDEAVMKMKSALSELVIEGVDTNAAFLHELISSPEFAAGDSVAINARIEKL